MAGVSWRLASCAVGLGVVQHCRQHRVAMVRASVGESSQTTDTPPIAPRTAGIPKPQSPVPSSWGLLSESTVAAPATGSSNVVEVLKANRSVRLLRGDTRRLRQRRLAAFASAVMLTALAFYGQDLLEQLGRITALPIEEIDGLIYFIIGFNAVSLALPKSRLK